MLIVNSFRSCCILYCAIKKDVRLDALVRLLRTSGARIAEVLALNLDEIDLNTRKFQVVGKGNSLMYSAQDPEGYH